MWTADHHLQSLKRIISQNSSFDHQRMTTTCSEKGLSTVQTEVSISYSTTGSLDLFFSHGLLGCCCHLASLASLQPPPPPTSEGPSPSPQCSGALEGGGEIVPCPPSPFLREHNPAGKKKKNRTKSKHCPSHWDRPNTHPHQHSTSNGKNLVRTHEQNLLFISLVCPLPSFQLALTCRLPENSSPVVLPPDQFFWQPNGPMART